MCCVNAGTVGTTRIVVINLAVDLAYGVPPFV
jgi:hypothetical protein